MKYYIRDYANNIVGNPKGYLTYKGAAAALNCKYKTYAKLRYYLWDIYDNALENGHTNNLIYSIAQ